LQKYRLTAVCRDNRKDSGTIMKNKELATGSGAHWKIILGLLVAFFIGAQILTMVFAARTVAPVVDHDYYQKGLHYGETLRLEKAEKP